MGWAPFVPVPAPRGGARVACGVCRSIGISGGSVPVAALHLADQRLEVLRLAEIAVDGSETDIGHLVQAGESLHDELADDGRLYLVLAHAFEAAHDTRDHAVDPLGLDRALA